MGGLYIDCGSFAGSDDKSGKPILIVFQHLQAAAGDQDQALLGRLLRDLEAWLWTTPPIEFRILPDDAQALLPWVRQHQRHIAGALPSLDERELSHIRNKEVADGSDLRGPAHQYRCVHDLRQALETSVAERQPVVLTWD